MVAKRIEFEDKERRGSSEVDITLEVNGDEYRYTISLLFPSPVVEVTVRNGVDHEAIPRQ